MGDTRVDRRLPLIVGLIGTVATIIAARGWYPGLGNDATSYLAIADHIAAGKGLGYFLEPKLGLWPPGFPVLLAGEKTAALPPLLHGRVYADFRDDATYFTTAFDLILSLYQFPPNHPAVADLRESLRGVEFG